MISGKEERKPASRASQSVDSAGEHNALCRKAMRWAMVARGVQVTALYATAWCSCWAAWAYLVVCIGGVDGGYVGEVGMSTSQRGDAADLDPVRMRAPL